MNEGFPEVWVLNLDEGAVVVNDDGTTEPLDEYLEETPPEEIPEEILPDEVPVEDPPAAALPEETPVEDVPVDDPLPETIPEDEVIEDEIPEETVVEILSAGTEDPVGYSTVRVTSIDVLETEQSGDVSNIMVQVIEDVLGEYRRQTYTIEEYNAEGDLIGTSTEYVPGLAGLDYAWITGAILFALFVSAFFKLLGGLIRS